MVKTDHLANHYDTVKFFEKGHFPSRFPNYRLSKILKQIIILLTWPVLTGFELQTLWF